MKHRYALIIFFLFYISFANSKDSLIHKIKVEKVLVLSKKEDSLLIKNKELQNKDFKLFILKNEKSNLLKDILPIITLFLGFFLNRGFDYFNERKKIKKSGERWKSEINSLQEPISKQIQSLQSFLVEHNKEKYQIPILTIFSPLDCAVFDSLDKSDLIQYFEKFESNNYNEAIKNSNFFNFLIVTLKDIFKIIREKYTDYLKETSKFTVSLNINLNELIDNFTDYATQIEKELDNPEKLYTDARFLPLASLIQAEIIPYQNNSEYDIYILEEKFFTPFLKELNKLRTDDRTKSLFRSAKNGIIDIQKLKREKQYLDMHFNKVIERYTEILPDIEIAVKHFKDIKD
ncbi:hypothetical protein [Flavobacterium sp. CF136]|uniref:hypothetical protein n=1 Tax=Flavobacterium sp. (strain CF136) TaxID=1144313 RepID=UPI0002718DA8|nr:hypothetical protein [Flavobacterium sp. CF136]EJL66520.1 hypothetical protein PMI10_00569 [Flavobacterium sp. CF136]